MTQSAPLEPHPAADEHLELWPQMLAIAAARRQASRVRPSNQDPGPLAPHRLEAPMALDPATIEPGSTHACDLISLYAPLLALAPDTAYLSAHLGQSIDGRIAARDGQSRGLNGQANQVHLHRMRALCDAVMVGSGTVIADDPQLTTRLVCGPNPVRVVVDGGGRIDARYRICQDGAAPTLILRGTGGAPDRIGQAEVVVLPADHDNRLPPQQIAACLADRGLDAIFIEGGGVTVSRFLEAGALHRLQVTIAPIVLGSGIGGLSLSGAGSVASAMQPPMRQYALGNDRLWDFDLAASQPRTGLC